jgi:hypothetical protein
MNTNKTRFLTLFVTALLLIVSLSGSISAQKNSEGKLTTETLLIKHLDSIGTAEARAAVKSITAVGTSKAVFQGRGGGFSEGIAVLASEGEKYLVAMKFNNAAYPFEKLGYDGSDFSVGFVRPGIRSVFGDFLRTNENVFKRGVMSGVLSTSWDLLNINEKEVKLKYSGTKKIDGKQVHQVDYSPKKGSDLSIKLFFDADTFRHTRTEYKRTIAARMGANVDSSAGQSETRYTLVENFSDFKEENKLTLPHNYKIYMEILTGNGTTAYEWLIDLQKFNFNQTIDSKDFKVDTY